MDTYYGECELFKYNSKELIEAKHYTLQKLRLKQAEIIKLKQEIRARENTLLLIIDFKAAGCTNKEQRTAYINDEVSEDKNRLEWLEHDVKKFTDDLTLINDLLKLNEGE